MKRNFAALALGLTLATPALADWQATLDAARGQTVYWNAWAATRAPTPSSHGWASRPSNCTA